MVLLTVLLSLTISVLLAFHFAFTVRLLLTLLKLLSHPSKVYPSLLGSAGAVAEAPALTLCVFKVLPKPSVNVTVKLDIPVYSSFTF